MTHERTNHESLPHQDNDREQIGAITRLTIARLVLGQDGIIEYEEAQNLDQMPLEQRLISYAGSVRGYREGFTCGMSRTPEVEMVNLEVYQRAIAYALRVSAINVFGDVDEKNIDFTAFFNPFAGDLPKGVDESLLVLGGYKESKDEKVLLVARKVLGQHMPNGDVETLLGELPVRELPTRNNCRVIYKNKPKNH